jgi:hypothetical protein
MTKKKIIILAIVLAIVSIITVVAINAIIIYNNILNEPRLNVTKVQEYLNKGGSLDDPVNPNMFMEQEKK